MRNQKIGSNASISLLTARHTSKFGSRELNCNLYTVGETENRAKKVSFLSTKVNNSLAIYLEMNCKNETFF